MRPFNILFTAAGRPSLLISTGFVLEFLIVNYRPRLPSTLIHSRVTSNRVVLIIGPSLDFIRAVLESILDWSTSLCRVRLKLDPSLILKSISNY